MAPSAIRHRTWRGSIGRPVSASTRPCPPQGTNSMFWQWRRASSIAQRLLSPRPTGLLQDPFSRSAHETIVLVSGTSRWTPESGGVTDCHNSCQTLRAVGQRVGLRVHIRPHRERHVGVAEPGRDHRGRDALQVHRGAAGMPGVVQPDPRHTGRSDGLGPHLGQRVGVIRLPGFVAHHVTDQSP
jgi:hypothetical protein